MQSDPSQIQQFIQAGIDQFYERIWQAIFLLGAAVVTGLIGGVVAYRRGSRSPWVYITIGATLTLVVTLASLVTLAAIPNRWVAFGVAITIWVVSAVAGWALSRKRVSQDDFHLRVGSKTWLVTEPTISRRTYRNEVVEIDGRNFESCTFANATLYYRGRGPFIITNAKIQGTLQVQSDYLPAKSFLDLIEWLRMQPGFSGGYTAHMNPQTGEQFITARQLPASPPPVPKKKRGRNG